MLYRIKDSSLAAIKESHYDIAFFASGYEERSTFVAQQLSKENIPYPVVLGFKEISLNEQRKKNDSYYKKHWCEDLLVISGNDDDLIFSCLRQIKKHDKGILRILVDYSSMSRIWYASVLNWARFVSDVKEVSIDFIYAVGEHYDQTSPMVITDILSIPGCEGSPVPLSKSVAVFGLGFEGLAALCVLDKLEPDEIYAYLASPAAFEDYRNKARDKNKELINLARATFELPINSVEQTFSYLSEVISPHRVNAHVIFVPMGPKPHILAAILLSMRFEEVSCLRVSGKRKRPEHVGTTGKTVVTNVTFKWKSTDEF